MENYRILAKNEYRDNDTWKTQINNNDLIIGPSGAGKTRYYVKPNLLQCNENIIVADTKGNLHDDVGALLEDEGYTVLRLDFKDLRKSCGYNPLDFIRYDEDKKQFVEQDIYAVARALIPILPTVREPFWPSAAQQYAVCMISYIMETFPENERHLGLLTTLISDFNANSTIFDQKISALYEIKSDCLAVKTFALIRGNIESKVTHASIMSHLSESVASLIFDDIVKIYTKPQKERVNFTTISSQKTAVFLCISDTERSMDVIANLFYTQALQNLCIIADNSPKNRLKIPLRIIFDDFATNTKIADFDKIISVIRSREIYVSVILQSISQLYGLYGSHSGKTIINNCDNCLYLGGQDLDTADFIAKKANIGVDKVMEMPLNSAFLFTRGEKGKTVEKYSLTDHPNYPRLLEINAKKSHEAKEMAENPPPLKTALNKEMEISPVANQITEKELAQKKELRLERRRKWKDIVEGR